MARGMTSLFGVDFSNASEMRDQQAGGLNQVSRQITVSAAEKKKIGIWGWRTERQGGKGCG